MRGGSWLFPDGVDRERMLEMDAHLQPVRRAVFGVLGVALIASGPWLGWWTLAPLAMAVVAFRVADKKMAGTKRPEYAMFAAWSSSQVIMAASVALSGGPKVATMSWFAIPVLTLGSRFSERGIAVGVGFTLVLMSAVAFGVDAGAVIDSPPRLLAPAALVVCVAMFQTVLMRSDVKYRAQAVIDPLTGMLNRKALDQRGAELEQQSLITGQPIGLIVGDIDHFKRVNDSHGHAAGDGVLKDVAYEMRKQLRAFDLFYRIGGEEFLILLPGADLSRAALLAEQLREAIAAEPRGGHAVTMSFGVAASTAEAGFKYAAVFAEADGRLYEAKRSGRNRVFPAVGEPAEPTLAAPA
ncbi:MAG: diguanylate cyclase [Thermoleophilaceae bacterium]